MISGANQLDRPSWRQKAVPWVLGALLYSLAVTFFCAGCSPFLKDMQTDSSVFFNIGRGMTAGKAPYRDLFDHKGIYLYFVYWLGAAISRGTVWGIYLVESLFMAANVLALLELSEHFLEKQSQRVLFVGGMLMMILNYTTYECGGLTEDYVLTFQLLAFCLVVRYYASGSLRHPPVLMLLHGVLAAAALMMRANMVFMWAAIGFAIVIPLAVRKEYRNLADNLLFGVLGVVIGLAPAILYCLAAGNLTDMIEQSFLFNMTYTKGNGGSLLQNMAATAANLPTVWITLGLILSCIVVLRRKGNPAMKRMYVLGLLLSFLSVALSGRVAGHYYVYLLPFLIPIAAAVCRKIQVPKRWMPVLAAGLFCLTVCCNLRTPIRVMGDLGLIANPSTLNRRAISDMTELYQAKWPGCTKVLDMGFEPVIYNRFDVIPEERYFYIPGMTYEQFPEPYEAKIAAALSGDWEIIIAEYADYQNKTIFGIPSEEPLTDFLRERYTVVYEGALYDGQGMCMYVRNDRMQ